MGNGTYADAFPNLSIIAHTETRTMMEGYLGAWYARHVKAIERLKQQVATGQATHGKPLTPAQLSEARNDLSGEEQVVSKFPNFVPRLPDMTFEREMNLNLGNRPVEIKYLGRGNTPGDVVVFLPKERILITGDIVVHPIPYLCSGYPSEWVQTLGRLIDLDPQTIIPGHGDVLHDLTYPRRVQKLLSDVVAEVRHSLYEQGNGKPLDDIRKQVEREMNFDSLRREFDGGNPGNFDQSSAIQNCLLRNAYYEEVLR
jgi:cyclase